MLTFDEFFKKKRIDLLALEQGEPALFSEFKTHFGQMGEKSFDHTKKYWFNKVRRQFPLAPEIKAEKATIENQLAEQTITESLIQTVAPTPSKVGFTPRFKAGSIPKATTPEEKKEEQVPAESAAPPTLKVGFKPRFKAANTPKPGAFDQVKKEEATIPIDEETEAKTAYKPRFNMKSIPPKQPEE
jgi:hypothetical protein